MEPFRAEDLSVDWDFVGARQSASQRGKRWRNTHLCQPPLRWHHAELLKNKKNVVWPDRDSQVGELLWDELDHRCSDGEPALCSS